MRKQWRCGEWSDWSGTSWLGSSGVRFEVQLLDCGAHNRNCWAVLLLGTKGPDNPFVAVNTMQATGAQVFLGVKCDRTNLLIRTCSCICLQTPSCVYTDLQTYTCGPYIPILQNWIAMCYMFSRLLFSTCYIVDIFLCQHVQIFSDFNWYVVFHHAHSLMWHLMSTSNFSLLPKKEWGPLAFN